VVAAALAATTIPSATASAVSPPTVPSPICTPRSSPPTTGLTELSRTTTGRFVDLTLRSTALPGVTHTVVLLPAGYDGAPNTRYPVLYLLHGHGGGQNDWRDHDVEHLVTAADGTPLPVIVVMPDGGYDGWYSNWYGVDLDGHSGTVAPGWESFHIGELIPFVDATFRTEADRAHRAIAGLSMGGFGAMSYAARHPDLFASAAAFSGAVDTDINWPVGGLATEVAANLPDRKEPDLCVWGDPITQHANWQAHDPTAIAGHLRGLRLFVSSGDGVPNRGDDTAAGAVEAGIFLMSKQFVRALHRAGIPVFTDFYGNGVHAWGYWQRELTKYVRGVMRPLYT